MKKPITFKSPKLKTVVPRVPKRFKRVPKEERAQEAISTIPRITNETVAEHREQVLGSARKYIYPLEHSKHRIVVISTGLLIAALLGFFVYCGLALYRFHSSSAFIYRVTQVIPFPVAKAGPAFVAYENYLFELRRYTHYYQTQQRVDFGTTSGKEQLASYKPKALQQVIDAAYVKQLANKHHISVSNGEVNTELDALRAQNQLGSSNQELADVTNQFFGWSINDLKRELKQELLAQKVAASLDTAAQSKADSVERQLQAGSDFATLASQLSDDTATKANGGKYANESITASSTDVPPAVVQALQKLTVGQVSPVITTSSTLEIVKLLGSKDGKMQAAHISFHVQPITVYITSLEKQQPAHTYITSK